MDESAFFESISSIEEGRFVICGGRKLIVVARGCEEAGLKRLAEAIPIFCTLGLAKRYRVIPQWMLRRWVRQRSRRGGSGQGGLLALIRNALMLPPGRRRPWPAEMRDAARLELFRLDIKAIDELRLAARFQPPAPVEDAATYATDEPLAAE
ncbi:MAG: hypothetical protein DLM68_14760 [Hyphomicrobiales bacterium]|nr:MAG: hypothetical protein DLM68_14760 [Hyphomicrobiales bacterium]